MPYPIPAVQPYPSTRRQGDACRNFWQDPFRRRVCQPDLEGRRTTGKPCAKSPIGLGVQAVEIGVVAGVQIAALHRGVVVAVAVGAEDGVGESRQ